MDGKNGGPRLALFAFLTGLGPFRGWRSAMELIFRRLHLELAFFVAGLLG
jgi:hypothetical protein